MKSSAVILAAGRGSRMGARSNKVFLPVGGRPILHHVMEAFSASSMVHEIVLVVGAGEESEAHEIADDIGGAVRIVRGGVERRDSALAGVEAAVGEIVLIHDGARPFVDVALIERVIEAAVRFDAVVPVVHEVDTLRYLDDGQLQSGIVERNGLVRIQTPQGFRTSLIRECLRKEDRSLPDDAAALLLAGYPVHVVPGNPLNIKLTCPEDMTLGEAILLLQRSTL